MTKKEQLARMKAKPLFWNPNGTTDCECVEHKAPKAKKVPMYEAWNYSKRCSVCGVPAGVK